MILLGVLDKYSLLALSDFLTKRSVDFKVDCVKDGKPTSTFVNMPISQKVFNKMVEIAGVPHPDLNDLAFLKLKGYDEYEELMPELDRRLNELQSSGTFDSISYNGDFPYQVYENL